MRRFFCTALVSLVTLGCTTLSGVNVYAVQPQSQITRSQVEGRALSMINLTWTYDSTKNAAISATNIQNVTVPKQLSITGSAAEIGIPYNWGGLDGIDTNSFNAPWTSFTDAISKGAFAGNVNSTSGLGYITGTAGLDCSGFVQATFGIHDYKLSTSTLFNSYFTQINLSDIKHMDILDHPGDHVVIFDKWGTLNGVSGAYTYEATTDQTYGGIQGTKQYFITMNEINKGYIPGRYINIVDDSAPTPTPTPLPVNVGSLAQVVNVNYSANFRSSFSINSSIVGTIPKGIVLNVKDYNSGWCSVIYNGKQGWISATLVAAPVEKYVTVNGVYQLNIRSNASMNSYILGVISQEQYAKVLSVSSDGNWYNISLNGIQGYASSKYLK